MAYGQFEGKGADAPEIRALFTREALLASDWYAARLAAKQQVDVTLWKRHVTTLEQFTATPANAPVVAALKLTQRLQAARAELAKVSAPAYRDSLRGTLGRQPLD
jgi:hypothetical protein